MRYPRVFSRVAGCRIVGCCGNVNVCGALSSVVWVGLGPPALEFGSFVDSGLECLSQEVILIRKIASVASFSDQATSVSDSSSFGFSFPSSLIIRISDFASLLHYGHRTDADPIFGGRKLDAGFCRHFGMLVHAHWATVQNGLVGGGYANFAALEVGSRMAILKQG
ncbi:hypothetical protein Nepgr_021651 [Nepenthes gracilis]|uniref:Uncharacterized protein n=1 Tax=Nepenthes gracilis TaxID=150966 RepID=A0AAD3SZ53_NEPGR|nr:hypothetical protein Nepgr_021651 [Nepenthes gracilis]